MCSQFSFRQSVGEIPEDWNVVRLGDKPVSEIIMGQSPPSSTYNKNGTGLPFLQGKMEFGDTYPSLSVYCSEPIKVAEPNDILISVRAPVGDVNLAQCKVCIGRGLAAIRFNNQVANHLFYFYYFQKIKKYLEAFGKGSTFKAINRADLENLMIPLPSLSEQRKSGEVLGVVDLAIAKTGEVIAKTERLKKGLMQELLTKGIGHKEYKQTPIGKIPKEWDVVRLKDAAIIERGRFAHRPRNEPRFYGGKIPFIQTGDVAQAKGLIKDYSQTLNEEGLKISKLFKKGTLVVSIAGNIGDVGMLGFDSCFPDSVIGIQSGNNIDSFFLMHMLQSRQYELSARAPRSTQKNINLEILGSLRIPIPPFSEQQRIAAILSDLNAKLELERKEKVKVEKIKLALMDLLLSGKVRVRVN